MPGILPNKSWLTAYLEYVEETEPPFLFKLWVGIGSVAAAMQRKCWLDWKLERIFPNMYIILCGPPGCRKGTAMRPARYFIEQLGIPLSVEATTREALIRKLSKCTVSDPELEALGYSSVHSSLTVFSEELTVFLGQNNWQLMSDLNNWFDTTDKWTYETVGRGEDTILGVWVNLIGATTPEFLETALPQDAIGGGLTSRIIFVFGDRKSKLVSEPHITEKEELLRDVLLSDLDRIQMLRGEFKFTNGFFELYDKWYREHNQNPPFTDRNFLGYNDRKALHLRKLAMILCAARGDSKLLEECDLTAALDILAETEKYMHFSFSGRGRSSQAWLIEQILRRVIAFREVDMQSLYREYYKDATKDEIDGIIRHLQAGGYVTVSFNPETKEHLVRYCKRKE